MHFSLFSLTVAVVLTVALGIPCQSFALAAPGSAPGTAINSAKQVPCSRPIQIAASPIGRSMMISPEGKITGATKAFFDLIEKDTACVFEYVTVPRARAWHMLEAAQIDLVADATRSPDRDRVAQFVEVGKSRAVLISLPKRVLKPKTVDELIDSPLTLITLTGHFWGQAYVALLSDPKMQGRISSVPSPETAVKMLLHGRADTILTSQAAIADAWEKSGNSAKLNITELEDLPALTIGLYMSKAKMSEPDRKLIESAIFARIKSGDLARIASNYYPVWAIYQEKSTATSIRKSEKR